MSNGEPTPPELVVSQGRLRGERLLLVLGVALVVVCASVVAAVVFVTRPSATGESQAGPADVPLVEEVPSPVQTLPEEVPPVDGETVPETDEVVPGGPFALNAVTTLRWAEYGEAGNPIWNITVGDLRDITGEVRLANLGLDLPADDVVFAGFDVEMTLVAADEVPLGQGGAFTWQIVGGATNEAYERGTLDTGESGCRDFETAWSESDEVFIGGTVSGTVCIPLPLEDLDDGASMVALDFRSGDSRDRAFFAPGGSSPQPVAAPDPAEGFVDGDSRATPLSYNSPLRIELDLPGDADGSAWTATISEPVDITDAVIANDTSQFPDEAPDGVVFAGFNVSLRLESSDAELLSPGLTFTFEIVGGASAAVYNTGTVRPGGCQLSDNRDAFVGLSPGGVFDGVTCIPIPAVDLDHPNTHVSLALRDGTRVYFGDS